MASSVSLHISEIIQTIRGQKVIIDADLAELYGVTTKRLNEQIRRNKDRFPDDFMFRLSKEEFDSLRSQNATSKQGRGGRRYPPYVFTEHGALMAANVLNSPRAVSTSVQVVRAFVRLRQMSLDVTDLNRKVKAMEMKYDEQFRVVFEAIRELLKPPPEKPKRRIGFKSDED